MYQLNLRAQASKLASLAVRWPIARLHLHCRPAEPRQRTLHLSAALTQLAKLARMRVMPGETFETADRHDPRDPRNW